MATKKTVEEKSNEVSELRYIDFIWNGTTYTMEYNRRSIEYLEKHLHMNVAKTLSGDISISDLPNMFQASLLMHHQNIKTTTVDAMYEDMSDKMGLLSALIELLANAINSVFEEPEEGKAISWTRH